MVAYHFPPLAGSSGVQRTLRLAQQLPAHDWQPVILTTRTMAYERVSPDLAVDIPASCRVERAFAFDTSRHLSLGGRYIAAFARPDRWVSWKFDAVRRGMQLIRELRPRVIWSTYPIATAHLIGCELARRSGLPWIADFRDPMAQEGYPADPKTWQQFSDIEAAAMSRARLSLFTSPGAAELYRRRYPHAAARIDVLENGYDEESFVQAEQERAPQRLQVPALTLLHSGIVYPSERDPTALFNALGNLKRQGRLPAAAFRLRFRAAVHDELLRGLAQTHQVEDLVEILPAVPYKSALREMLDADALLVMQGSGCNDQIPAKAYEYLRARRAVLGLCDPAGDTARLLVQSGLTDIANLSSVPAIEAALPQFIHRLAQGQVARASEAAIQQASRRRRTAWLAARLTECAREGGR